MRAWPKEGLWRHGDFLHLWGAQSVSQLGSQVTFLALLRTIREMPDRHLELPEPASA
jgi:hypothetical protein